MILDGRGELVWFQPLAPSFSNLQVQTYRGEPVLTWWQGKFMAAGFGQGVGVVADRSYRQVATVKAGNGLAVDLHELVLTPEGSALITAVDTVPADLRPVGGPAAVTAYTGVVQEVDVATGKVLFQWRSIDHVPVDESHATPDTGTFDYFHVNSIDIDPEDGNLLVSARNTWTVYKLDRSSGAVVWRLGGKRSDFSMGPGAGFAWQHDARAQGRGVVTIFDDGASPAVETHSRAIWLTLDEAARTARLEKAFTHPARLVAENQGSLRVLADGDPIVGWGSEPYFSHFDSRGGLLRDGRMPTNLESYRAFRSPWAGASTGVPDIATETDNVGGAAVYVSWNGATDVSTWQVWTGTDPSALQESGSVPKGGFETALTVHQKGPFVAVRALDANGTTLATSKVVHL
jgi:hypothetical protein